jgi:hypothetical protein
MPAAPDFASRGRRSWMIRCLLNRIAWVLIASLLAWGCSGQFTSPPEGGVTLLEAVRTLSAAKHVSGVVLHVSGRGIEEPVIIGLGVPDSLGKTAPVDAMLPTGPHRVFRAYAYTRYLGTHETSDTADVTRAGLHLALDLPKYPGSSPSTRAPSDFIVRIDDAETFSADSDSTSVAPGDQFFLSVEITAGSALANLGTLSGDPLPDITVGWGMEGSDLLQLSDWICVTGSTGTCSIRVFVSPLAETGTRVPIFASTAGVADRITVAIQ